MATSNLSEFQAQRVRLRIGSGVCAVAIRKHGGGDFEFAASFSIASLNRAITPVASCALRRQSVTSDGVRIVAVQGDRSPTTEPCCEIQIQVWQGTILAGFFDYCEAHVLRVAINERA